MIERYYVAKVVISMQTGSKWDEDIHKINFYLSRDGELTNDKLLLEIRRQYKYRYAKSIDIEKISELSAAEFKNQTE